MYDRRDRCNIDGMFGIISRVVNEYPVNRLTIERTEYRLVKLVLGYSVKKKEAKCSQH